ncbi:MAG: serine/threonine-protein kinase, partial [Pseudomonadota bacterium]
SIKSIGRWPWNRQTQAELIETIQSGGAKTIGVSVLYSEPERARGLDWISEFREITKELPSDLPAVASLNDKFDDAEKALNTDGILGQTMGSGGNVVIGMQFTPGEPIGNPDAVLPDFIRNSAIPGENIDDPSGGFALPIQTIDADAPIASVGSPAAAIGHLLNPTDVDGGLRFEALVVEYFGEFYPSLSLAVAANSLNLNASDIRVQLGESVNLGNLTIKTDSYLLLQTFFYGEREGRRAPFDVYSAKEVMQGTVQVSNFKDKIVLIGPTAFGLGSSYHTPIGDANGAILVAAHTVASILNEDFFVAPGWAGFAEFLILLLIGVYLIALLPRLGAAPAAGASIVLFVVMFIAQLAMMVSQATWIQLMTPCALLVVGHVLLTTKRYLVTEASKRRLDVDSAASNRQLALQFQQQGQLDMAFDAFRKLPADEQTLEAIYVLGGDFERKRQFNKAAAAYEYIASKDPSFRDIKDKVSRAKQLNDTVIIGGSGGGGASQAGTMLLDGSIEKPMLGRYEVEKELGKGAMGIVYLGKDPMINRVVAIKTMGLAEEFEGDELEEARSRFFREAETAGRLDHPNIVRIYDVGEEHDLAFIAMEFLKGKDLVPETKPDALLPVSTVLGIIFKSAVALDYAHKHNVVHRDIKPANIMYDPENKQVKLTDFGIARITDSSKTKTGMVLGTPSYMSPEQLSGKKVDGRSDLFSLGVMFYQMLCGKLPFQGDSMATLMYRIANEEPPNLREIRPDLVGQRPCIEQIIQKALVKDPDARYQTGAQFAKDIQQCAKSGKAA